MNNNVMDAVQVDPVRAAEPDALGGDTFQAIWRRKWVILLVTIICVVGAYVYISRSKPTFSSSARIYIERTATKISANADSSDSSMSSSYLYAQCELLRSSPVLKRALQRPEMAEVETFAGLTDRIGALRGSLTATVGARDDIITIAAEANTPEDAVIIVSTMIAAYKDFQREQHQASSAENLDYLKSERATQETERVRQLAALTTFRKDKNISGSSDKEGPMEGRLSKLSDELILADQDARRAEAVQGVVDRAAKNDDQLLQMLLAQPDLVDSSALSRWGALQHELDEAQLQKSAMQLSQGSNSSGVRSLQARIDHLTGEVLKEQTSALTQLKHSTSIRLQLASAKRDAISAALSDTRTQALKENATLAEFSRLEIDYKRVDQACMDLDQRIQKIEMDRDVSAINISVLEPPAFDPTPLKFRKSQVLGGAGMLGLVLGAGAALLMDWTDQRLRSVEQIQQALGLRVLGVIDRMAGRRSARARAQVMFEDPASDVAETFRTVRTAVRFGSFGATGKTLLITSPDTGDGKTTFLTNLAISMAQAGQRVLIVDTDFRRPMMHEVFNLEPDRGLSRVLEGKQPVEEAIQKTAVERLEVLTCGYLPANPSETLHSKTFTELMEQLEQKYDHILLDSPPVTVVTDALILAAMSDATILVVRAEKSKRKLAREAMESLASVNARVSGVIVNDMPRAHGRASYYGSRYGQRRGGWSRHGMLEAKGGGESRLARVEHAD